MHLKGLRLKGFKSFPRQTELVFEPGVAVIIGPNGSGKSNLADAVMWALGEQSPSNLRGASMQDVIFAGSDGRRPLAHAEVELTFDNRDGALALPADDVSVMRRVSREGASHYFINHSSCRLTDVVELMAPVGLGKELHSIISQGRVEAFLAGKPEDRRSQIEEAAGLGAYKRRRDRAELKLRDVGRNLEQAVLLEREVATQLAPLRRQASAAEQLRSLDDELAETRARLLAGDLATLDTERDRAAADLCVLEAERARAEAGLERAAAARTAEEDAFARRVAERERRAQRLLRARLLDARLESGGRLTEQRLRLLDESERSAAVERQRLMLELAAVRDDSSQEEWESAERRLAAALEEAEAAHAAAAGKLREVREELSVRRAVVARLSAEREASLATAARLERRGEEVAVEESRLAARREQFARDREEKSREERAAAAGLESLREELRRAREAAKAAADAAAGETARVNAAQERLQLAEREARALNDELDHLGASLRDLADVDDQTLAVAAAFEGTVALSSAVTCEPGFELALAAALAQVSGGLAVPATADRWSLLGALRQAGVTLAKLLVVGGRRPGLKVFEGATPLLNHVRTGGRLEVESALAEVVVVDDLRRVPAEFEGLAVTRDGAYYRPGAGQLGLAAGVGAALLLERRAALTRVSGELAAAVAHAADATAELSLARERERAVVATSAAAAATERAVRARVDEAARRVASLRARGEEAAALLLRDERALASLAAERGDAAEGAEAAAAAAARVLLEIEQARPAHDLAEAKVAATEDAYVDAQALLTRRRVELEERHAAARRAAAEREAARARLSAGRARLAELDVRLDELPRLRAVCAALAERIAALRERAAGLLTELEVGDGGQADLDRAALRALAEREAALRQELDAGAERRTGLQVTLTRLEDRRGELAAELEGISERLDRAGFAPPADEDEARALRERAERCSRRRAQIGPVNPLAAAECSELEERVAFLCEQRRDLEHSIADLESLITELTTRVDAEFAETFAAVREQFIHMVSVLFPGGRGSLDLVAPDADGGGGVAVTVKPAKKLGQRLQLLSGGERALVAIAFLMALVLARPSPLYILDEVEAALDDVNIGRLVKLLREYRDRTQFIVITHQKPTMDAADVLYGVTMGPDGGSQVVSARMAEAAIDREAGSSPPGGPPSAEGQT